jgi:hypothetical protein
MEQVQITPEMLKKNNIMSIVPVGNINEVQGNNIIKPDAIEVKYFTGESKIITGESDINLFLQDIYKNR